MSMCGMRGSRSDELDLRVCGARLRHHLSSSVVVSDAAATIGRPRRHLRFLHFLLDGTSARSWNTKPQTHGKCGGDDAPPSTVSITTGSAAAALADGPLATYSSSPGRADGPITGKGRGGGDSHGWIHTAQLDSSVLAAQRASMSTGTSMASGSSRPHAPPALSVASRARLRHPPPTLQ